MADSISLGQGTIKSKNLLQQLRSFSLRDPPLQSWAGLSCNTYLFRDLTPQSSQPFFFHCHRACAWERRNVERRSLSNATVFSNHFLQTFPLLNKTQKVFKMSFDEKRITLLIAVFHVRTFISTSFITSTVSQRVKTSTRS